ncbi:heme oxygenase 2 [Protopterus annectens]|uniref:heme oxygenase 2 n=1 Tax=Protopterus annectens TaxID=7888 RepID=UPI001CFBCB6A|nr:heme oxygenase 2 [Protopterus annectens]XP_043945763.1 heme oxygenase 2 [Protopterus annectens]
MSAEKLELQNKLEDLAEMDDFGYDNEDEMEAYLRPTDLSELLKDGTKESHERAENTEFVKDFLKGRIKKDLFKLATVALYFTYSAMEEELDHNKNHSAIVPLYFPVELHRTEALTKDLEYYFGDDWKDQISCSEATKKYVERIHYIGKNSPELLVAHAYTRYMGDLSGGQLLKKIAQRVLRLPASGEGVFFYKFDNISNAVKFKQLYRARLNALDLDKETKKKIVEEANKAFEFNMQVFHELQEIGAAMKDEVQDGKIPLHEGKGDIRKCPYFAAKLGSSGNSGCPYHVVLALLRQPSVQLVLAVCVALAAGAAAWYMM